jgi:putative hydrolase of the HAD superfamily
MGTIISDFDGVIVKSRLSDKTFVWQQTIESDLGLSNEIQAKLFPTNQWTNILVGNEDFERHLASVFAHHNVRISVDTFIDYWLSKDLNWYRDVLELFRELKSQGHQLYIATNQDKIRADFLRNLPEVQELFSGVFASSDLGFVKPNPDFFRSLKQKLGARNSPVAFVDDSVNNVKVAEEVGFSSIHFDPDLDPNSSVINLKAALSSIF